MTRSEKAHLAYLWDPSHILQPRGMNAADAHGYTRLVEASGKLSRAWYSASIAEFLCSDSDTIVGRLTSNSDFAVVPAQRDAWLVEIQVLQTQLDGLGGQILMEFAIPRVGRRVDAVDELLAANVD